MGTEVPEALPLPAAILRVKRLVVTYLERSGLPYDRAHVRAARRAGWRGGNACLVPDKDGGISTDPPL